MKSFDQRSEIHRQAQSFMKKGQYQEASHILENSIQEFGYHVGVLADLIASDYMLGKTDNWITNLTTLTQELKICRDLLTRDHLGKTLIFLAKMNEEIGEVSVALKQYEEVLVLSDVHREIRLNAQVQILRLKTYLDIKRDISSLYIMTSQSFLDSGFHQIEIEHSLLLAELSLFGQHTAFDRLKRIWNHPHRLDSDKRLVLFDYLEYLYRRKVSIDRNALVLLSEIDLNELDAYEKFLYDFLISNKSPQPEARKLSPFGLLKCLTLMATSDRYALRRDELLKQIHFHLESISYESRSTIRSFLKLEDSYDQIELLFDSNKLVLQTMNDNFVIKPGSFTFKCLLALSNKTKWSTAEFIKVVFDGADASLSNLERTRIAIQRLNTELRKRFGISKTVEFTKFNVMVNKKVSLRRVGLQ